MESRIPQHSRPSERSPLFSRAAAGLALVMVGVVALSLPVQSAYATGTAVDLGTSASYSVLGGQSVTNTGSSV